METTLRTYFTKVYGQQKLQVAQLEQLEKVSRTSRRKVLWENLELPTVVVSIEVPVTYTYNIDLKKEWSIQPAGEARGYRVVAPPLEWNRPAPDISAMEIVVEKSSVFRNENAISKKLLSELSGFLDERSEQNLHIVREQARQEICKLVEKWLVAYHDEDFSVEVVFPDEVGGEESSPSLSR